MLLLSYECRNNKNGTYTMYRARDGNVYSHKETPEEYEARKGIRTIQVDPLAITVLLFIGVAILEYLLPFLVAAAFMSFILILIWFFRGFLISLIKKTFLMLKHLIYRK